MNKLLIILSSIFLGIGLVSPTMTIFPKAGELTWLMEILDPESMLPVSYSIVGIIIELADSMEWLLVIVLTFFSVLFPVTKLYLFWAASCESSENSNVGWIASIVGKLSKFSMAEVFVLSLVLISLKTLPGGTDVQLEFGCMIYLLSVIFSTLSSLRIFNKKELCNN